MSTMAFENFGSIRDVAEPPPQQEAAQTDGAKLKKAIVIRTGLQNVSRILILLTHASMESFFLFMTESVRSGRYCERTVVVTPVPGRRTAIRRFLFAINRQSEVECYLNIICQSRNGGGRPVTASIVRGRKPGASVGADINTHACYGQFVHCPHIQNCTHRDGRMTHHALPGSDKKFEGMVACRTGDAV